MASCPFHRSSDSLATTPPDDPFLVAREGCGVFPATFQGKPVPMVLTHEGVREAARSWRTYSNNAAFRVPIPSEEDVRSVRQLPLETDPPEHTEYRKIAEPFFNRPKDPAVIAAVESLVDGMIADACSRPDLEIVRDFALPLQCRALALLLNVDMTESDEWIGWGTHVFRDGADGEARGAVLERYIHRRLDLALAQPGDDFFSVLTRTEFRGRPLTRAELAGFVNLTFAGGRDTIIQTVAGALAHLAAHPEHLAVLRERPQLVMPATEEFFRVLSPLTHIGRVCPVDTKVNGVPVAAGERVSLVWASANRDSSVFENPGEMRVDRKPNPHLAFGAGPHTCLGALHARLLVRTLLRKLAARVSTLQVREAVPHLETEANYTRRSGYQRLVLAFTPSASAPLETG